MKSPLSETAWAANISVKVALYAFETVKMFEKHRLPSIREW